MLNKMKMMIMVMTVFAAMVFSGCQMATSVDEPVDPYAHYYNELREIYTSTTTHYVYMSVDNTSLEASNIESCFESLKIEANGITAGTLGDFIPELSLPNIDSYGFGTTYNVIDNSFVTRFVVHIR